MKRKKVFLNLSKASVNAIKGKARMIVSKMTSNVTFPTPAPALSVITGQADLITAKQAEQDAAFQTYQQKTIEIGVESDNLLNMLEYEGNYVELIANGDETRIKSAGFDLKQASSPIGSLVAPIHVLAVEGNNAGEVAISWKPIKGARAYNVEQSADITDDNSWVHAITVTKAKCILEGQPTGSRIWVRVAGVGAAGEGAVSDVTTRIVP